MTPTRGVRRPRSASAIALLALVSLSGASCSTDPSRDTKERSNSVPTPTNSSERGTVSSHRRILYVEEGRLQLRSFGSRRIHERGRVPSLDVVASALSPWLAYVTGPGAVAEDFIERPELYVLDPSSGRRVELGTGFAPLWNPLDDRLAFLRPIEARRCEAETCRGSNEVVVWDAESEQADPLLPGGHWVLLAWAGDRLIVADRKDPDASFMVGPSGEMARLHVPPAEVWDASPNGEWLLTARPGSAAFLALEDGALGEEVRIDLSGGVLGEGAWAPDSSSVAAALRAGNRSRLVTFSPATPEPTPVRGASEVVGDVLWARDAGALATTQITDSGRRLQALYCRLRGRRRCGALFSWVQDVVLLRIQ